MNNLVRHIQVTVLLLIVTGITFIAWPEIDLAVAHYFYDPEQRFPGAYNLAWQVTDKAARWLIIGMAVLMLISWLAGWCRRCGLRRWPWRLSSRGAAFLILALLLGPTLAVNGIFKDHWHRARPHMLEEFGGTKDFTPAWILSDQCLRNCSFVSGHASAGFFIMSVGLLLARYRWVVLSAGAFAGLIIGLGRVAQGAHFLSDVVVSGLVVYLVSLLVYWLILVPHAEEDVPLERV